MIYFIQCNAPHGPIKIGYTKGPSPVNRIKGMKTDNPYPLIVLATLVGGPAREREIQYRFEESRIDGEWYKPTDALMEFITSIQNGNLQLSPPRGLTKRQQQMTRLYLNGFRQSAIAKHLGISRQAVHSFLGKRGVRGAIRRWYADMIEPPPANPALIEVMTMRELADLFGMSRYTLVQAAIAGRIEARQSGHIWLSTPAAIERAIETGRLRRN